MGLVMKSGCPQLHALHCIPYGPVAGDHDDLDIGPDTFHGPEEFAACHARQVQIHDGDMEEIHLDDGKPHSSPRSWSWLCRIPGPSGILL
jgi:hypothetical protein